MSEEADALAEAARNRGLKLVRSRVRSPEKRGFGKLGLTDARGEPVFGMKNGKPAAKPEEVAEFLRGEGASDWKASLKEVGGKARRTASPRPEPVPGSAPETARRAKKRMLEQVQHDEGLSKPKPKPKPEPKVELRDAKPGEAEQIAQLFALLDHQIDAKEVARNIKALAKSDVPVIVAARDKEVVGVCGVARTLTPHRETPVGRITVLVVAEQARGLGLGRLLVGEAENRLAKLGCALMEITSNDRLREAHALYRHLGYERTSMRFAKALPKG